MFGEAKWVHPLPRAVGLGTCYVCPHMASSCPFTTILLWHLEINVVWIGTIMPVVSMLQLYLHDGSGGDYGD